VNWHKNTSYLIWSHKAAVKFKYVQMMMNGYNIEILAKQLKLSTQHTAYLYLEVFMSKPSYAPSGFLDTFWTLSFSVGKAGHGCIHPQSLKLTIHIV
jgi:hypothetical protein